MHVVDAEALKRCMKERGFRSIDAMARALGVHRNTIHYYLRGHHIFPEAFERMLTLLKIEPQQILHRVHTRDQRPWLTMAPIFDTLHQTFPEATFVLFGSRARETATAYADWDLGVYARRKLPHATYRRIVDQAEELAEATPYMIQVVNLHRADPDFLARVAQDWQFVAGSWQDWIHLQQQVAT